MGKVVKVDLEEKKENQGEPAMSETNQDGTADVQEALNGLNIQLVPKKNQKKGLLDIIWRDRGIFGKAVTVTVSTAGFAGLVIGIKALVTLLFGPEAAEMIDPSMIAPTEE